MTLVRSGGRPSRPPVKAPPFRPMTPVPSGRGFWAAVCAIVATAVAACGPRSEIAHGELVFDACSPCHGEDGAGNQLLAAPAIAGADPWYVKDQLERFQGAQRGYNHLDEGGLRMRPMSRVLGDEAAIDAVVAYVASLPMADPPPTGEVQGDAVAGAAEYALLCANCHGDDGRGARNLNAPSLLHLSDWYVASSLRKYRDQVRGARPGDAAGATMRAPVAAFTDQQIDDVTAYVVSMPRLPRKIAIAGAAPPPLPPVDADPAIFPAGVTLEMAQEGQDIFHGAGICNTCHLEGGAGGPLAPNLTDDVWLNIDGGYDGIVSIVEAGVPQPVEHPGMMLPRAGAALTDEQVRSVAAYVFTLSR